MCFFGREDGRMDLQLYHNPNNIYPIEINYFKKWEGWVNRAKGSNVWWMMKLEFW